MSAVLSVRVPRNLAMELSSIIRATGQSTNDFLLTAIKNEVLNNQEKRILLIDDDPTIRELLKTILNEKFLIVGEAENGKEGIKLYKELSPAVVILDIIMPTVNGVETLKKIMEINNDAKVIILSGLTETHLTVDCIKGGAFDYIVKGATQNFQETIISTVQRAISTKDKDILLSYNKSVYDRLQKLLEKNTKKQ